MKKIFRAIALLLTVSLATCVFSGCDKQPAAPSFTKETAYALYCNTIQAFVPEQMTTPRGCDVDLKIHDDVTYSSEHFVRDITNKVQTQVVSGGSEFYVLSDFPDANARNFCCIRNGRCFSTAKNFGMDKKGELKELSNEDTPRTLISYLPIPSFDQDAIKSFVAETNDTDTETKITFTVDGTRMEILYMMRLMREISPDNLDCLDDIKITLTVGQDGKPTTMTLWQSLTRLQVTNGKVLAQKTLETECIFNEWDTVSFDLDEIAAQYTTGIPE